MAPRRAGAPLGAQGVCRQADLRLRDRRHDGHSQEPHRDRRLSHRLSMFSDTLPDEVFSQGLELADARADRAAAAAAGGRASGQFRGGICFCVDLDPRWVDQADQEGLDGASRSVQAALHRSGDHDSVGRARHQVHVHHAQAAGVARAGAGKARHEHPQIGHHRHLLRRHRVHAAVDPLRHRGISGRAST